MRLPPSAADRIRLLCRLASALVSRMLQYVDVPTMRKSLPSIQSRIASVLVSYGLRYAAMRMRLNILISLNRTTGKCIESILRRIQGITSIAKCAMVLLQGGSFTMFFHLIELHQGSSVCKSSSFKSFVHFVSLLLCLNYTPKFLLVDYFLHLYKLLQNYLLDAMS